MDWSSQLPFSAFVRFLERMVNTKKSGRFKCLQSFLYECRKLVPVDGSLFPVMRLLGPSLDKERGSYKMKETVLAKMYIDFLQLGKSSGDALKLNNFRVPKTVQDDAGDFASVLWTVLQQRAYSDTNITCCQINEKLDQLVRSNNTGEKKKILKDLFMTMDALQQKWLIRIILKNVKVVGEKPLLTALHRDAGDFLDANSNLRKLCEVLHNPEVRLNEIGVEVFSHFKPQLADRLPINKISNIFKENDYYYVETKYDGERMQAHMTGNRFKFFSRNGSDFTELYGETGSQKNKFAYHLASSLSAEVKSVILDGEICAWNHQTKTLSQKSRKNDIRTIKDDDPIFQQCLVVYDICYYNGKILTNLPLKERIKIYEKIITPKPGRIQFSQRSVVKSKSEILDAFNTAIDRQEEGLVLKGPDGVYKLNTKSGSSWIKLKPEYQKSLMDQLDLLVIGGSYGNGKGGGHITKFTLALADRSGPTNKFFTICGVANCSAADLAALTSSCGKPSKTPSRSIVCGRDKPNVWFNPESAPVVQVNAPEIIKSDSYSAGYTLRFPRIEMIRPDKDHTNCTTMEEMNEIRRGGDGKLFGNVHLIDDEVTTPRKRAKVSHRQTTLGQAFVHNDYSNERIETFNLKGKIVVVEPCLDVSLKHRCERIVVKHGGTIEQNLRKDKSGSLEKDKSTNSLPYLTSFYIQTAKLSTAKSTTIVNIGKIDVVKASWILDCENKFRNYGPHDVVFATEETWESWKNVYDDFGDSYRVAATLESLTSSLAVAQEKGQCSVQGLNHLIDDLANYKFHLFKGLTLYLDYPESEENSMFLDAAKARFYGAEVLDTFDDSVSHVVVARLTPDRLHRYKVLRGDFTKKIFHLVSPDWIAQSIDKCRVQQENQFYPEGNVAPS